MIRRLARAPFALLDRGARRIGNRIDPPVIVLLYHRVIKLERDPQQLAVSPENFREHLRVLKDRYNVVRFEDDWSKINKPAVVLTFDDGYEDNLTNALPILQDAGIPATFFITTGSIDKEEEFWWDELERLILGKGPLPSSFEVINSPSRIWPTATEEERINLYRYLHVLLKKATLHDRRHVLESLRPWAGTGPKGRPDYRCVSTEQLRMLAQNPLATIGAHSISHTRLSSMDLKAQSEEIAGSKRRLENILGREIKVFSYPFGGRSDFTRATMQLCKQSGFLRAAANFPGEGHSWSNPYKIPRHLVRDWSPELFERQLGNIPFA